MMNNEYQQQPEEGHNPIQKHLEEQFGQMRPQEEVPEELKEEVFNTLDTLHFVADLVDLFTVKFAQSDAEFLDSFQDESEEV